MSARGLSALLFRTQSIQRALVDQARPRGRSRAIDGQAKANQRELKDLITRFIITISVITVKSNEPLEQIHREQQQHKQQQQQPIEQRARALPGQVEADAQGKRQQGQLGQPALAGIVAGLICGLEFFLGARIAKDAPATASKTPEQSASASSSSFGPPLESRRGAALVAGGSRRPTGVVRQAGATEQQVRGKPHRAWRLVAAARGQSWPSPATSAPATAPAGG